VKYLKGNKDEEIFHLDFMELLNYSKKLNDELHTLKIKESERSLLIAGALIALGNRSFKNSYKKEEKINDLIESYLNEIKNELSTTKNKYEVITTFSFIKTHIILSRNLKIFKDIIAEIDKNINSFIKKYKRFDALGQFYIEFLRYANNDKGLGIVLTPPHIAELFCKLANINEKSVILDNCAGIGSFLVCGRQVVGIEYQHDIFTLLCCNMHIHGMKLCNLIKGSCFDKKIKKQVEQFKPNVGFLNPPYKKMNSNDPEELDFILNNLSFLEKGSYCIAIVPMSCALATKGNVFSLKRKLLQEHTLCAVLSMPNQLFKNSEVGVNTCAMIFKAKEKHPYKYKTLFMYCKEDGFTNRKTLGRADYDKKWAMIRKKWIDAFIKRESIVGFSVKKEIQANDEWCAEAYMQTDYSTLNESMFNETIMKHLSFKLLNAHKIFITDKVFNRCKKKLNIKNWREFKYGDIFIIGRGKAGEEDDTQKPSPLVGASQNENGTNGEHIKAKPYYKTPLITVGNGGNTGCGQCFFQSIPFNAKSTVNVLDLQKNYKRKMNEFIGMFLVTIIKLEKYRFNFGRGWSRERMKNDIIKLPVKKNGEPDFDFMEKYIKSLPYSKNLE
jgi:16S rRNA G966 N2-methylase RsmD